MTRLTSSTYRSHHHKLKRTWFITNPYAFTLLSPTEQMALHDFYVPTKALSDAELKTHRETVSAADPHLPQRAGKAFARIQPFLETNLQPSRSSLQATPTRWHPRHLTPRRRGERKPKLSVHVRSLVRPEIDAAKVAKTLLGLASQMELEAEEEERSSRVA